MPGNKIKIGINGFGRIGRSVMRSALTDVGRRHEQIEIVAINDLTDANILAHLLKYDSVHGRLDADVQVESGAIQVNVSSSDGHGSVTHTIQTIAQSDPGKLPWKELGVDVVLECTGRFLKRDLAVAHLKAGARKVVLSAPAKGDIDATLCMGINTDVYDSSTHDIVSNASCTTNCLAPVAKVLHEKWGIAHGLMTTVHAYTANQKVLDTPHKDLRRSRACGVSMIPTTTGAAKAIGLVLPDLAGKLDGMAIRVPTPNVSLVDLSVVLSKTASVSDINKVMTDAANGSLKGVLGVSNEPLVSIDYTGNSHSSTVDLLSTMMSGDRFAKVVTWYDNEYGYANRLWDLAAFVAGKLG